MKIKEFFKQLFGCCNQKKPDVRKIYKTTDGYFTGNPKIKKPRRVAVVEQRKDDKALAVVKIYSKKGKEKGKKFIKGLTLSPKKHSSLTEDSIVGHQIIFGVKRGDSYTPIYKNDFSEVQDTLTKKEHRTIKRKAGGLNRENRKTSKKNVKRWKNHFKE